MAKKGLTDDQLISQIEHWERQAVGYYGGEIAQEQAENLDYYLAKPYGTEEEGRSAVNSSDVWDVVEGLTPLVLKPFVASDDVVRFNPMGPEDEEAAQQESDYVNFLVTQRNEVFPELVAWVKTGLLQKNGVVKYWWEKSRRTEIERYAGLSDDEYAMLLQDDGIEVVEHSETVTEAIGLDGMPVQEITHDVVLRVVKEEGTARFQAIPPEEFLISRDATAPNPKCARFVEHRTHKTISELREMGYDVPDDLTDAGTEDPYLSQQYHARREAEETGLQAEFLDPSVKEVVLRECYVTVDFDGDGLSELRKVCLVGRTVLANEETEEIPFAAWTPYQQPHRFYGRCPADETKEIQLLKATTLRQTMDNIYTINNNRMFVSDKVNLDDLLDNAIGGIVRVPGTQGITNDVLPASVTPIGAITMPMIEYLDTAKENRTGFTRYNQGMDAESLNKTATGIRVIAEAGSQRVEMIARAFADGMRQLMLGIHGLVRRHAAKPEVMRLRGKWVEIDPRSWKTRYDMTVSVGLGSSDKQMQMQAAQMILAEQKQLAQIPGMVTPENFYHAAAKLVTSIGEKSPEKYFSDPTKAEPAPPPDPMQNPEVQFRIKELQQRDRELDLKEREIGDKADKAVADTALAAQQQGLDMTLQLLQAIQALQAGQQDMQMSLRDLQMREQGQAHSQALAEHGAMLSEQGQAHSQSMAEQAAQAPNGQV